MLIFTRYSWWVGAMVALAVFLAIAGQVGVLSPFQGVFLRVTSPIERLFGGVFDPVASYLADAGELGDLRNQNADLRLENERLQVRVAELQDEAARVTDLEAALGITSAATAEQLLPANVTARDSTIGHDVIRINVGSEHGIQNGQVVLSANGALIGTVTKVLPTQANVQLLSDSRSIVNAEIETSRIQGNVAGTLDHKLTFNRAQGEIKVGERVVTSGLGGLYPPGKVIGIVSEVSGTPQDLFRSVKVEPIVRLSTVETVLVITNFLPQRIDLDE